MLEHTSKLNFKGTVILFLFPFFFLNSPAAFSGLFNEGYSQYSTTANDSLKNHFSIYGNYYSRSNAIHPVMNNTILFGGFLDNEKKEKIANNLQDENYANIEWSMGFSYHRKGFTLPFMADAFLGVTYRNRNIYSGTFSKDAVLLTLYGNKRFEDQTAKLGPGKLVLKNFNEFAVNYGFQYETGDIIHHTTFSAGFLKGNSYNEMEINRGDFYTAPGGEFLSLDYDIAYRQSNTAGSGFFDMHGAGFNFGLQTVLEVNRFQFMLSFTDLGLIQWNKGLESMSVDTNFVFEGLFFPQIFDFDNPDFVDDYVDSLQNTYFPTQKTSAFKSRLPALYTLRGGMHLSETLYTGIGLSLREIEGSPINAWAEANFKPVDFLQISALAGYSTLEGLLAGLELHADFKNAGLRIGSSRIVGLLAPSSFTGADLYVGLHFKF